MLKNNYAVIFGLLLSVALLIGCSPSTEDLAKDVRANISKQFEDQFPGQIEIISLDLVHKGGNEYTGILETNEPNGKFTYAVDVVSDGERFSWELRNPGRVN